MCRRKKTVCGGTSDDFDLFRARATLPPLWAYAHGKMRKTKWLSGPCDVCACRGRFRRRRRRRRRNNTYIYDKQTDRQTDVQPIKTCRSWETNAMQIGFPLCLRPPHRLGYVVFKKIPGPACSMRIYIFLTVVTTIYYLLCGVGLKLSLIIVYYYIIVCIRKLKKLFNLLLKETSLFKTSFRMNV